MNKLTPSRVRRDLAEMRARLAELERGVNPRSFAAEVADSIAGSVQLVKAPGQEASEVAAAVAYARWLRRPSADRGVALGDVGKKRYEQTLAELRQEARGSVILDEVASVIARLERLPGGGVVRLNRARSPLQKFMAGGARMVRGWASTSQIDRQGDVVVPAGMKVQLPIPLLWQHDHSKPIGTVISAEVRESGIWIEAKLVEGIALADEAVKLTDARAIDAFSVGFRGLRSEPIATGLKFTSWDLYEVSVVSVPANAGARIQRSTLASAGAVKLTR
jgi:HK97 family phage prohead protease